ncbi:hypothetical protein KY285_035201 [Solanum tuberosum]|nr:hypothetical protein KY285_035201 [Solanum tuberosum]
MLEVSSSKPVASESKGFAFWVELVAPGLPSAGYLSYVVCELLHRSGGFTLCAPKGSMIQTQYDLSTTEGENTFIEHKRSDVHGPTYASITTSKGLIIVELYKDGSPDIVDEFVDFCQKGHFKGMRFNRVIKHFVIHGSKVDKPEGTEDWTLRGKHYSRLDTSLKHEAFMLGTSKTNHEGEGFDLFITTAPIPDLNDKINVFGRVIKGEDIVQEIEEVDTDDHYRPKTPVQINEVTLKYST